MPTQAEKISKIYETMGENRYTIECYNSCGCVIKVPVMIGNVLDYLGGCIEVHIERNMYGYTEVYTDGLNELKVLEKRKDKRKPIPLTPHPDWEEVIDFIYGLIE